MKGSITTVCLKIVIACLFVALAMAISADVVMGLYQ
jgi:hypothetical protein